MTTSEAAFAVEKPMWRKIIDFPLMAMLIAAAVYIAVVLLSGSGVVLAYKLQGKAANGLVVDIALTVAAFAVYKLVIRHLGRIKKDDLPFRGAARAAARGLGAGVVIFTLVVAAAAVIGVYRITGRGDLSGLVAAVITDGVRAGVTEEIFFRGILFRWLEQFGGSWLALAVTAALFGAIHMGNPGATWVAAFGIAVEAGILLGAAYMLTRELWFPIGLHAGWNLTQGEIFDIPVSGTSVHGVVDAQLQGSAILTGGSFGLEASVVAMIVATAAGIWLLWLAIRKGELMQPMWVRSRRIATAEA